MYQTAMCFIDYIIANRNKDNKSQEIKIW
jgi:hypothetical protein